MPHVLTNPRHVTDEIMDHPDVDPAAHLHALIGLRRINRLSRAAHRMAQPIIASAKRAGRKRISLLDIACGGGDVPIAVALAAQRSGISVDLTLLDRSATALRRASAAAAQSAIACRTVEANVLADSALPTLSADIVTNSLFLHHLPQAEQVIRLLRGMSAIAKGIVVVSDLRRSRTGLLGAWLACRLLTRSKIVHHDGPASMRAAWTIEELADFARQAGMNNARIQRCSPWRMLLVWEKPQKDLP